MWPKLKQNIYFLISRHFDILKYLDNQIIYGYPDKLFIVVYSYNVIGLNYFSQNQLFQAISHLFPPHVSTSFIIWWCCAAVNYNKNLLRMGRIIMWHTSNLAWGGGISWLHRSIITGLFAEYSYD